LAKLRRDFQKMRKITAFNILHSTHSYKVAILLYIRN